MRVVVAIAAMVGAPVLALADEPTAPAGSTPAPAGSTPAPAPASTTPAPAGDATAAPGQTPAVEPKTDPAYGEKPEYDTRDFPAPRGKDVVIVSYPERTRTSILWMSGLAAGGLVFGGIGLYFHLDSRSAADEVSAHKSTGEAWTPQRADTYDRAHSSAVTAGVLYGIGGGLVLATAILYIATEPKPETMVIHPHTDDRPTALVAPTRGGAMIGGAWRF